MPSIQLSRKVNIFKINLTQVAYRMCEERIVRMKRDTRLAKRRARRLRQLHELIAGSVFPLPAALPPLSSDSEDSSDGHSEPRYHNETPRIADSSQIEQLQHVAARTINLMHQNAHIQRKLEELKRETAAFVVSVMRNPENRVRFGQFYGAATPFQTPQSSEPTFSETSSFALTDDTRSLPDLDNDEAHDGYEVEIKREFKYETER